MRNNETGEFEVVFGNRQLLSGFFIAVLLFAVAFAMGYVVGENSRSARKTEVTGAAAPGPSPAETRPQPASAAPANPPAATPVQQPPADSTPQPTTQPSREVEAPREVPPPVRETKPVAAVASRPDPSTSAPSASAPPAELAPGNYWQVLATANRDSAQNTLETLKEKGFPVSLGPGPNNLTRVLVGPYRDTTAMGRAKTELESAGFHPVRH
jgi:cell division septation protein DedD